jgi:hypothetical protein
MHSRSHRHLLLHCQRHSGLRRARIPHRRPFRNPDVLPPYGMHVAIRQLERQGPQREVDVLGFRQHFPPGWRNLPFGRWNLWRGAGHYRCVRCLRRFCCLVLRRQLQLGLKAPIHEDTIKIDTRTSHGCARFIHASSLRRSYGRDA